MRNPDDVVEVVITAPRGQWLPDFTRDLVRNGVAACGHHCDIRAVYSWQAQVQDEPETRVALHTTAARVPDIEERLRAQHPYDVPCLLVLPVLGGSADYLEWVRRSSGTAD